MAAGVWVYCGCMALVTVQPDVWVNDGGTYRFGRYTIRPDRLAGRGWIVDVADRFPRVPWRIGPQPHRLLSGAKAWAMHHQQSVVRRKKLMRHSAVGALFLLLGLLACQLVTAVDGLGSLGFFVAGVALLALGLREFVGLVNHALGDTDYFEMGSETAFDRAVVESLDRLRSPAVSDDDEDEPIRIVTM